MNAALLALLIGAVYFAPAHIAGWAHWSPAAIEYLAYGIESSALWVIVGMLTKNHIIAAVCAWGAFEALQRPLCRAMFDLSHKVALPDGVTMCEAAFGLPIGWFGFVVAGMVIMRLTKDKNGG